MVGFIPGALGGATVTVVINAVDRFSKTFDKARARLVKLGAAFTAVGIAGAFAAAGVLKVSAQFEQTQIAFTTMLGSAEKADKLLRELADFAKRTPFTLPGVEKGARQLLAMGFEADELIPALGRIGDVIAGLGLNQEGMDRMIFNLGQIKAQGRAMLIDVRQFAKAGVPIYEELAKAMGVTVEEIGDLVSAGKVGFPEIEQALINMTSEGGKFFNLMDAQSKTLVGQINNIKDSFTIMARVMGEDSLEVVKSIAGIILKVTEWTEKNPEIARFAFNVFLVVTGVSLLLGIVFLLIGFFGLWAGGMLLLVGLITTLILLFLHWDKVINFFTKLWKTAINGIIMSWEAFLDFFQVAGSIIINIARKTWAFILDIIAGRINKVIERINLMIEAWNFFTGANKKPIKLMNDKNLENAKESMIDIVALVEKLAKERKEGARSRSLRTDMEMQIMESNQERNKLQEELTKITDGQTAEVTKQITEQQKLEKQVEQLAGLKVLAFGKPGEKEFGDIFQPAGPGRKHPLDPADFASEFAFSQAQKGAGKAITIFNIESIIAQNPEEIAEALERVIGDKIST